MEGGILELQLTPQQSANAILAKSRIVDGDSTHSINNNSEIVFKSNFKFVEYTTDWTVMWGTSIYL